jgi:regulator of ribonuclease activity A
MSDEKARFVADEYRRFCDEAWAARRNVEVGIKALGTNPRKSAKVGVGEADIPVTFGGLTFAVGDRVFSDADGVLAIAPSP